MDLSGFLRTTLGSAGDGDAIDALRAARRALEEELARTKSAIDAHDRALAAMDGLRRCERSGFMSNECSRWFFVAEYAAVPDGRRAPRLTRVSCIVVPEAVIAQTLHRPVPHADPAQAARGVVTMTPTPVSATEIARDVVAAYASGVRLGGYGEVRTVACPSCGKPAVLAANHGWDYDSGCQWLHVGALCPRCPRFELLAGDGWDDREPCPLLPPSKPPARR